MERLRQNNHLNRLIERKQKKLPENSIVLGPGEILPLEAAVAMNKILSATYGRHNLMTSIEQLVENIESEKMLPWFIKQDDRPIACAALIINQDSVEIGRIANHPQFGHNGSLLALEAFTFHQRNHNLPLVAEIRLSDNFKEIVGGQASQVTLLKHANMKPFAIMPAFHHPGPHGPDRQEFFCFCIDRRPEQHPPVFLPEILSKNTLIRELKNSIFPFTQIVFVDTKEPLEREFQIDTKPPFNMLQISSDGLPFKQAMLEAEKPFTLATIPATPEFSSLTEFLVKKGFIPCGLSWKDAPSLLLGKLRNSTTLAPLGLASNCFNENMQLAIVDLEKKFRQSVI